MSNSAAEISKILDLPDEEFSKISGTSGLPAIEEPKKDDDKPAEEVKAEVETEEKPEEVVTPAPKLVDPANQNSPDVFQENQKKPEVVAAENPEVPEKKAAEKKPAEQPQKPAEQEVKKDEPKEVDQNVAHYKEFYDKVLAPFKANHNTIQLSNADEVIRLMQMGANYTKKLQALQPQKKLLMMLENNGLLSEEKIGFLIDLDKKNPEAIKKLLKDSNIDPVEFDTSKVNYRSGSHAVSDQEATIATAIEELEAQDGGSDTLKSINKWDTASKKVLWEQPELLNVIHAQRVNGIYAKITAEVEKRKTLGTLPATVGFLNAYKMVGDELAARGAFQPTATPATAPKPAGSGVPVAVRTVKTPTQKTDDNRVRAAAPTRTAPKTAQVSTNYLSMSDEEFLKLPPPGSG